MCGPQIFPGIVGDDKMRMLQNTLKNPNLHTLGPQLFAAYNRLFHSSKFHATDAGGGGVVEGGAGMLLLIFLLLSVAVGILKRLRSGRLV